MRNKKPLHGKWIHKDEKPSCILQLGFLRRVPQGSFSCRVAAIHLPAAGNFVPGAERFVTALTRSVSLLRKY